MLGEHETSVAGKPRSVRILFRFIDVLNRSLKKELCNVARNAADNVAERVGSFHFGNIVSNNLRRMTWLAASIVYCIGYVFHPCNFKILNCTRCTDNGTCPVIGSLCVFVKRQRFSLAWVSCVSFRSRPTCT